MPADGAETAAHYGVATTVYGDRGDTEIRIWVEGVIYRPIAIQPSDSAAGLSADGAEIATYINPVINNRCTVGRGGNDAFDVQSSDASVID